MATTSSLRRDPRRRHPHHERSRPLRAPWASGHPTWLVLRRRSGRRRAPRALAEHSTAGKATSTAGCACGYRTYNANGSRASLLTKTQRRRQTTLLPETDRARRRSPTPSGAEYAARLRPTGARRSAKRQSTETSPDALRTHTSGRSPSRTGPRRRRAPSDDSCDAPATRPLGRTGSPTADGAEQATRRIAYWRESP